MMTYEITENERERILGLYNVNPLKESISKCLTSRDGKYILFENKVYSSETGEELPLTEAWTTSDWLHTIGDAVSIGMDFVIPGSGAVVDTLNGISYIIEAQFKDDFATRASLYTMAAVQFAFVLVPGPLQATIFPLKKFLKTGVVSKAAKPLVEKGLLTVRKLLSKIFAGIPRIIWKALNSRFGKALVRKFGKEKIDKIVNNTFVKEARKAVDFVLGTKTVGTTATKGALDLSMKGMTTFFKSLPKIARGKYILKKLGFKLGKEYGVIYKGQAGRVLLKGVDGKGNVILEPLTKIKGFNPKVKQLNVPIEKFLESTVHFPWLLKAARVPVPLFIRTFSRWILPDGSGIDYEAVDQTPDLNPDQTSMESLAYMHDELPAYQGDTRQYTVNNTVQLVQNALIKLNYSLPKAGADGKFGPETRQAISKFQVDNDMDPTGKLNRSTVHRMALRLKEKGVSGSEDLQNKLVNL